MEETITQIGELKDIVFRGDFINHAISGRSEWLEFIILDCIKNRRSGVDVFDFVAKMMRQVALGEIYAVKGAYSSDGGIRFKLNERDTNPRDNSYLQFNGEIKIEDDLYVARGHVVPICDGITQGKGKFEMKEYK